MGKGCVRFKKLEDLALDLVGRTVARVPVGEHGQLPGGRNAPGQPEGASVGRTRVNAKN
jgi:hypothetical protein